MLQFGLPPFFECSSRGDKRFSAFHARIARRGNRTIEEIYQSAKIFADGRTGLSWREAKGRRPVNSKEVRELYSTLWREYIEENLDLLKTIACASGLSDIFGQPGHACQAEELWKIRREFKSRVT